jgi:uncharacterized membrane protein
MAMQAVVRIPSPPSTRARRHGLVGAVVGALCAAAAAGPMPEYTATWMLPKMVPHEDIFWMGHINNRGEVAGSRGIERGTYSLPFRWSPVDGYHEVEDLPGGDRWAGAGDIDDRGEMIPGFASTATGQHAVVWSRHGRVEDLSSLLPAGMRSGASRVNERGQVMGSFTSAPYPHYDGQSVFVWSRRDGMRILDHAPGLGAEVPTGFNDRGVIVGWGCGDAGCTGFHGTAEDGLVADIPGLPNAVNDRGQVVGRNLHDGPAFIWDASNGYADLPMTAGAGQCAASDINASGVAVGWCDGPHGGAVAWYPGPGGYVVSSLARHIGGRPEPFPPCGGETCFYSVTAPAINDAGQIVVSVAAYPYGYIEDADLLILTPVVER